MQPEPKVEPPPAEDTRPTTTANGSTPHDSERAPSGALLLDPQRSAWHGARTCPSTSLARVVAELTAHSSAIRTPDDGTWRSQAPTGEATEIMRAISTTRRDRNWQPRHSPVSRDMAHVTANHAASRWARENGLSI